jgi:hypothetical protein
MIKAKPFSTTIRMPETLKEFQPGNFRPCPVCGQRRHLRVKHDNAASKIDLRFCSKDCHEQWVYAQQKLKPGE